MARIPNLNALRMFDAAARHLNFRAAAEEMHLTQGAVAQQVRRLEADLGQKLFHRKARGLALTDTGRSLHAPVARALALIETAARQLTPERPHVTLSVTPSIASKWLVPRLPKFSATHPNIDVQIIASEALSDFQSDGADAAIRQGEPPTDANLAVELISPLRLRAACSPAFAQGLRQIDKAAGFAGLDLVQDSHRNWDRLFAEEDIRPEKKPMQFNQTALGIDAASNGQGVVLAPKLLLDMDLDQGRLVELWCDRRTHTSGFYAVWPKSRDTKPAVQTLVSWILEEVRGSSA
ncbi:LysR substrate-binding domain-containing protein [Hoeflea prorocentri]|uniref:LysR substrate-binding domain-containing protein n=1 Tax=Hoeflea prorocentri TaxID=1922333 RepID=A0A9X3UDT4_9HYPH|nr:LysR substrate-binding domain-containing protein [Hoeflea prorocentri]MCY6379457.1 LysR substrate-binding domain-containing protein [Hoeflea prorocentri]MDA5397257.1 LysR substrate-binding domain-containing protein [Hoeflea prorocentri]